MLDLQNLTTIFLAETEENLTVMEESLIAMESNPQDGSAIQNIFRAAHTLKGNADSLGFPVVTQFAHVLEDVLQGVRDGTVSTTTKLITLLLKSVDALRTMVPEAVEGSEEVRPEYERLRKQLAAVGSADQPGESGDESSAETNGQGLGIVENQSAGSNGVKKRSAETVRVSTDTLDQILNLTGEIAIARGRLTELLRDDTVPSWSDVVEAHREGDSLYMDLQELVMKSRMVPLGPSLNNFHRTVRDVTTSLGKEVTLVIEGADVEVDLRMVELLRDPLTHMVRNALHHGIESPSVRKENGKSAVGQLTLRAFHDGGYVVIQVVDDGGGLPKQLIIERARERKLIDNPEAMPDSELYKLIFEPGFSTASEVSKLSGRGVGMDVVRRNIESLNGTVVGSSEEGKGTTFTIRLPLTLAIMEGFGVEVGNEVYIIQLENVVECLELPQEENGRSESELMISLRGSPLPCIRLRNLFSLNGGTRERENVVVVRYEGRFTGLVVDSLYGQSQAVIKPLGKLFNRLPGISGSTIMGNGQVALILDVAAVVGDFELSRKTVAQRMSAVSNGKSPKAKPTAAANGSTDEKPQTVAVSKVSERSSNKKTRAKKKKTTRKRT